MIEDALTLDIFSKLMAEDTINPPGNELRGAQCLKALFDAEGIPCEIQDLGDNRANVIAEFGEGERVLEFSGHLDVVPCVGDWHYTPIGVTEKDGKLYGRGSCDMKGGIAAMCSAAISLFREHAAMNGKIRLVFVADEEHANLGMHAFLDRCPAATWTLLGEPTDLHVAVAHRGVARYYVDLHGRACHAALRTGEVTAVTKAARAIFALNAMNDRLLARTHAVLPPPSIVVTQVQGYEKDNVVPGDVRLLTDFRILPGMSENESRALIVEALDEAKIDGYTLEKRFYMPGGEMNPEDGFVADCCEVCARVNGREENPRAFDASCEQCFLVDAGAKTVVIGPGSLDQAHTVDEFVRKDQLLRAASLYREIALKLLA